MIVVLPVVRLEVALATTVPVVADVKVAANCPLPLVLPLKGPGGFRVQLLTLWEKAEEALWGEVSAGCNSRGIMGRNYSPIKML